MANTFLKHKKCNGALYINVASMFILRSPSIGLTSAGVSVGVLQLEDRPGGTPTLCCSKCGIDMPMDSEDVVIECSICNKFHPVDRVFSSDQIMAACNNCISMLTGEKPPTAEVARITEFMIIPRGEIKFVSFSEILKKPVKF